MMLTKRQLVEKPMEEDDLLLTAVYVQLQIIKTTRRKRKKRSVWMRDWLQHTVLYGQYEKLVTELKEEDARGYKIIREYHQSSFEYCSNVWVSAWKRGHLYDQFQTTGHIGTCYGYAAVVSRRRLLSIRFSTVTCG